MLGKCSLPWGISVIVIAPAAARNEIAKRTEKYLA
jgi:hypothetical protein